MTTCQPILNMSMVFCTHRDYCREPKNIKEAMADSAWIEAMQEKLHQFDRLQIDEKTSFHNGSLKEEVYVCKTDWVEHGIIELYFVRTEYQLADIFTKALLKDMFQYLVKRIGMRCLTLAELEVLTDESA
ncbi:hypothetical protein Tco_0756003 [Tanacetum coccineum]